MSLTADVKAELITVRDPRPTARVAELTSLPNPPERPSPSVPEPPAERAVSPPKAATAQEPVSPPKAATTQEPVPEAPRIPMPAEP